MHRTLIIFLSTMLLLVAASCTGKSGNAVAPVMPTTDSEIPIMSTHQAVDVWLAEIDPIAKTFEITSDTREGTFHFPLTQLYSNSLQVTDYGWTPNFWADIKLKHPLSGGIHDGFDPRVIAIVPVQSPGTYFYYPILEVYANNSIVLNPDGYTKLFDNLGGSIPGNTNPFKAYFQDQPYRRWSSMGPTEETQRWQMDVSGFGGPIRFGLVVDVSTNYPNPPYPRFDNASEPVKIDTIVGSGLSQNGGSANITVTVLDWQGQSGIGGVKVEAPDLFNSTVSLAYFGLGPNPDEYVYTGIIGNSLFAPEGEYKILVATWDQNTDVYLYNEFPVSVAGDYLPQFNVTTLLTPVTQNVVIGEQDFDWMYAEIINESENESILITEVTIEDTLGDADDDFNMLNNAAIWADLDNNGSYETCVSNLEQFADNGLLVETYSFNLIYSIVVESSVKIALRTDLSSSATADDTHTIRISEITAVGQDSGIIAFGIYEGTGQTMTIINHGLLSVIVDLSSPLPQLLVGSTTYAELAVFRFSVTDEDQFLNKVTITDDGDDNVVTAYKFYADRDGSGNSVTPFLVDTVIPSGGVATLNIDQGVRLLEETYTRIYVKADVAVIDGSIVHNGDTVKVTIAAPSQDIDSVGLSSDYCIYGDSSVSQDTSEHRVYESIPTVTLSPLSPSGNLILSPASEIAIFRITADTAGDITMENGDSNQLVVKINTYINDYSEGATSAVWLKNKTTDQVLDSVQYISFGAGANTTTITFDMDALDLEIPAGGYRDLGVVVDTTRFTRAGDSIVAWLDDDEATNFSWGINGAGNYATADISFRGDIYARMLVKEG